MVTTQEYYVLFEQILDPPKKSSFRAIYFPSD